MTRAAGHTLVARERRYGLDAAPYLMGILNATPDSFSDAGDHPDLDARVERGLQLLAEGADLLDVGGESGVTNRPAVRPGRGDRARRAPGRAACGGGRRRCPSTPTSRRWRAPPSRRAR